MTPDLPVKHKRDRSSYPIKDLKHLAHFKIVLNAFL